MTRRSLVSVSLYGRVNKLYKLRDNGTGQKCQGAKGGVRTLTFARPNPIKDGSPAQPRPPLVPMRFCFGRINGQLESAHLNTMSLFRRRV